MSQSQDPVEKVRWKSQSQNLGKVQLEKQMTDLLYQNQVKDLSQDQEKGQKQSQVKSLRQDQVKGLTQGQVKEHIDRVQSCLSSVEEKRCRGYEFGKLCFQVKNCEDAIKYFKGYLKVKPEDSRAHLWIARSYESEKLYLSAIYHYRRFLHFRSNDNEVILKVAVLYKLLDSPPLDKIKRYLAKIQKIPGNDQAILLLKEMICKMEGTPMDLSAKERLLKMKVAKRVEDPIPYIDLVQQYTSQGRIVQAYQFCIDISEHGNLTDSMDWLEFFIANLENFLGYHKKGNIFPLVMQDGAISLWWHRSLQFQQILKSLRNVDFSSATKMKLVDIILKLDQDLYEAFVASKSFIHIHEKTSQIVTELCGQLYLMVAQYFYVITSSNINGSSSSNMKQLGDLCLMRSLMTVPTMLDSTQSNTNPEMWSRITTSRQCLVGWHMLLISSYKENDYCKNILQKGSIFNMIRHLLDTEPDSYRLFDVRKSFLVTDDQRLCQYSLPGLEEVTSCDQGFLLRNVYDIHSLAWLYLTQKVIGQVPHVSDWISLLFSDLPCSTDDLTQCSTCSLCKYDLEAFLVLQCHEFESNMTLSVSNQPLTKYETLLMSPPGCLLVAASGSEIWCDLVDAAMEKFQLQGKLSLKIQDHLGLIRNCGTFQLSMSQLLVLARHFTSSSVSQWSQHYWSALIQCMASNTDGIDEDNSWIYQEANLALKGAALSKCDLDSAKHNFYGGHVLQAAENQYQIYCLLADWTSTNTQTYFKYLEKATRILSSSFVQQRALNMVTEEKVRQLMIDQPSDPKSASQLTFTPTTSTFLQPLQHNSYGNLSEVLMERTKNIGMISNELFLLKAKVKKLKKMDYCIDESKGLHLSNPIQTLFASMSLDPVSTKVLFEQTCTIYPDNERKKVLIYVLLESTSQRTRIVMCEEQRLSICFNHYITSDISVYSKKSEVHLKGPFFPNARGKMSTKEWFVIQFMSPSIAMQFELICIDCMKKAISLSIDSKCRNKKDSFAVRLNNFILWECSACFSFNMQCQDHCTDCLVSKPTLNDKTLEVDLSTDRAHFQSHEDRSLSANQVSCCEETKKDVSSTSFTSELSLSHLYTSNESDFHENKGSTPSCEDNVKNVNLDINLDRELIISDTQSITCTTSTASVKISAATCTSWPNLNKENGTMQQIVETYRLSDVSLPATSEISSVLNKTCTVSSSMPDTIADPITSGQVTMKSEVKPDLNAVANSGNKLSHDWTALSNRPIDSGSSCTGERKVTQSIFSSHSSLSVSDAKMSLQTVQIELHKTSSVQSQELGQQVTSDSTVSETSTVLPCTCSSPKPNSDLNKSVTQDCIVNVASPVKSDSTSPLNAFKNTIVASSEPASKYDCDACVDTQNSVSTTEGKNDNSILNSSVVGLTLSQSDIKKKNLGQSESSSLTTSSKESVRESTSNKSDEQVVSSTMQNLILTDNDQTIMFEQKCKLFMFNQLKKQWSEHGRGKIQIFLQNSNKKYGIIMKNSQTSKLCCYHYFQKDMKIMEQDNIKTLVWHSSLDYSEEIPEEKRFIVKFNGKDQATTFKLLFEKFVKQLS